MIGLFSEEDEKHRDTAPARVPSPSKDVTAEITTMSAVFKGEASIISNKREEDPILSPKQGTN